MSFVFDYNYSGLSLKEETKRLERHQKVLVNPNSVKLVS